MSRNVTFNLSGGGELNIPARFISGFYKDEITSDVIVEVLGEEYIVRDSLDEIKYILGIARWLKNRSKKQKNINLEKQNEQS